MTDITPPRISPYGDHAILVDWASNSFSDVINDQVHMLAVKLRESGKYIEVDDSSSIKRHVEDVLARENFSKTELGPIVDIPVNYGGAYGPDMERICSASKLSVDDVIKKHSGETYRVCMMGFIPGFTFLSPAPKALHHPRLETPRAKVPAGSIGIANWQTGIYGLQSPGGWQIIGQTPLSIFNANRETPFLLNAGDRVRFIPQ